VTGVGTFGGESSGDMSWDELLDTRAPAEPSEIRDAVNHQLGIGVRRVRYRDGLASPADVAALRDQMEI
jgi:hypothetical protein